jgi:Uma2 family endonuclease
MFPIVQTSFLLPTSIVERLALEDEIRVPATLEEYLEFAEQAEYKVEYANGHIISMGQASDSHELICSNLAWVFNSFFTDKDAFRVYGSNLGIYLPAANSLCLPDVTILNAAPEIVQHKIRKRTVKSVLNPLAIIEVFSDGTWDFDMTEKLPAYKQCESLQYIIYVHQNKPFLTVYTRSEQGWLSQDFKGIDAAFTFEGHEVLLKNIYRKVIFPPQKKRRDHR